MAPPGRAPPPALAKAIPFAVPDSVVCCGRWRSGAICLGKSVRTMSSPQWFVRQPRARSRAPCPRHRASFARLQACGPARPEALCTIRMSERISSAPLPVDIQFRTSEMRPSSVLIPGLAGDSDALASHASYTGAHRPRGTDRTVTKRLPGCQAWRSEPSGPEGPQNAPRWTVCRRHLAIGDRMRTRPQAAVTGRQVTGRPRTGDGRIPALTGGWAPESAKAMTVRHEDEAPE